ncbi:MAG: choice-of-anchor J domain-containing protein, partial [Nocardioidaceae bacterium]
MTAAATAAAMAVPVTGAAADSGNGNQPTKHDTSGPTVRHAPPRVENGKLTKVKNPDAAKQQGVRSFAATAAPQEGDVRQWLSLNNNTGGYYFKPYQLRSVGDHIAIWVAIKTDADGNPVDSNGDGTYDEALGFPADSTGACRNTVFDGQEVHVTQDQLDSFVHEFDSNIYPTESNAFSVPKPRDGSNAALGGDFSGPGDRIVTLIDNVRDANYTDPSTPAGQTYIAGFFAPAYSTYEDRNMMTIDGYDWLHRTGANPPDDSGSPQLDTCPYASGSPRPHLYEGTFAHEYQHLLEHDVDADEVSWVNEGLSDYAQTLVGYVDPSTFVKDPTADSHIGCFTGWLADQGYGGSENSLTEWSDQGGPEILCDYGAAYSFMQYLRGHFGLDAMSALHKEPANGLDGLDNVLAAQGSDLSAMDVVHRWAATMALDHAIDNGAKFKGGDPAAYSEDSLDSVINFQASYFDINHDGNPGDVGNEAYSTPGAPPNGADYVRARNQYGGFFSADQIDSISFQGAKSLAPDPLQWTVDPDAHGAGDPAIYSGSGNGLDRAAVTKVTVPTDNPTLSFDTKYDIEQSWDFGFVQVSTNGGKTYTSLPVDGTTSDHADAAQGNIVAQLPGFTGGSGGAQGDAAWVSKSYDLSKYAGQTIELSFRYMTDGAAVYPGYWIDNVKVGDTLVSDGSSLDGFQSATQV